MASRRRKSGPDAWRGLADAFAFGLDCQEVMLRRFARLAEGDAIAMREAQRMVIEKASTASLAMLNAATAWAMSGEAAASAALAQTYVTAVKANRRRLRGRR